MALPLVAVVGRPNVGKSTFVNRVIGADDAIVHEMRGVTRDRSYHTADWNGVQFTIVDTGGIEMGSDDDFQASISNQAFTATHEADVIVLIVDSRTGINADDEEVARILRKSNKPVLLAANKLDTPNRFDDMTLEDMEKEAGVPLHMVSCSPLDYFEEIAALASGAE